MKPNTKNLVHVESGSVIPIAITKGKCFAYSRSLLKVEGSTSGCTGCYFETPQGARTCEHRLSCFAHLRTDKKSVKFSFINKL